MTRPRPPHPPVSARLGRPPGLCGHDRSCCRVAPRTPRFRAAAGHRLDDREIAAFNRKPLPCGGDCPGCAPCVQAASRGYGFAWTAETRMVACSVQGVQGVQGDGPYHVARICACARGFLHSPFVFWRKNHGHPGRCLCWRGFRHGRGPWTCMDGLDRRWA